MTAHSPLFWDLRHDFRSVCVFIAECSLAANLLPSKKRLDRFPKLQVGYCVLVDLVAGFALNWRYRLPSLDLEFLGFRRPEKHYHFRKRHHVER